jgi:hypothetical protein
MTVGGNDMGVPSSREGPFGLRMAEWWKSNQHRETMRSSPLRLAVQELMVPNSYRPTPGAVRTPQHPLPGSAPTRAFWMLQPAGPA